MAQNLQNEHIIKFVKYLYKGIKKFGIKKIEEKLNELYKVSDSNIPTLIKNKIFDEITLLYGFSHQDIIKSKKRGDMTQAKVMAIILLYRHLNLSQLQLALMFNKGLTIINRRIKTFSNIEISRKLNQSQEKISKVYYYDNFMDKFEAINNKIINYKNQIKVSTETPKL